MAPTPRWIWISITNIPDDGLQIIQCLCMPSQLLSACVIVFLTPPPGPKAQSSNSMVTVVFMILFAIQTSFCLCLGCFATTLALTDTLSQLFLNFCTLWFILNLIYWLLVSFLVQSNNHMTSDVVSCFSVISQCRWIKYVFKSE